MNEPQDMPVDSSKNMRVHLRDRVVYLGPFQERVGQIKAGSIGYVRSLRRDGQEYQDGSRSWYALVAPSMDVDLPDADWVPCSQLTVISKETPQ